MFWPLGPLEIGAYDLVMCDPPWTFALYSEKGEEKSAQAQYSCLDLEAIQRLPISGLAKPDCLLWLWCTNPLLREGIATLEAWGFEFKTAGHWAKTTKHGKQAFGTGFILRCAGEPFIIGTRGNPKTTRVVRSVIMGEVRQHSQKPDEAYREAERLMPTARRADVFSRRTRIGWENWGDERQKFDV